MRKERLEETLEEAWIGDAVLALYARSKILLEDGGIRSEKFIRMTSNRFLSALGDPTEVEAGIGRVYQRDGLDAAFRWIDSLLLPHFQKQEANRLKREGRGLEPRLDHRTAEQGILCEIPRIGISMAKFKRFT